MTDTSASAHPGSTAGVRPTVPTKACKAENCETRIHIGIFDGTAITRRPASFTYRDDPQEGYFAYYVKGLGTPCQEIGETEASGLSAGFASPRARGAGQA